MTLKITASAGMRGTGCLTDFLVGPTSRPANPDAWSDEVLSLVQVFGLAIRVGSLGPFRIIRDKR